VTRFTQLVLQAGVSLRGASRVMALYDEQEAAPHWTTGRLWLERLGLDQLTVALPRANDWAWLADHSVQLGQEKCLAILGIRLRDLPPLGECLRHEQMELIALVPRKSWTRQEVDDAFEEATERAGPPRVIVDDHGVDLSGGVSLFQERHPGTTEIYDIKHKGACILKHRLGKTPRWLRFLQLIGMTRCQTQQTELAFLSPGTPHAKSRFMNLENDLRWARRMLILLDDSPAAVTDHTSRGRLRKRVGWLTGFRREVHEWGDWWKTTDTVVKFINRRGIYRGVVDDLRLVLPTRRMGSSTKDVAAELTTFVAAESKKARPGERLPGSTEVLESCFGKFKNLERDQARGGFTSFVLALGAMLAKKTASAVASALKRSPTRAVHEWRQENLGQTLAGKRTLAFQFCATKMG
jgi:hypothetical protein